MAFVKGQSGNLNGKPKGVQNKITKTVKETVLAVFNEIQSDPKHNLKAFAKSNPKDFYIIAAKLIPTEVSADVTVSSFDVTLKVDNPNGS
jgi:hypothetical protein